MENGLGTAGICEIIDDLWVFLLFSYYFLHKIRKEINCIMERFEPEIEACIAEIKEKVELQISQLLFL